MPRQQSPRLLPGLSRLASRCGIAVLLLSALAARPQPAQAYRQVHLDVNRYCRDTFAAGKVANGRKFIRDGRHSYRNGLHGCLVQYRLHQPNVLPAEYHEFWEVWANKACREQNRNPRALSRYDGPVIWCLLP